MFPCSPSQSVLFGLAPTAPAQPWLPLTCHNHPGRFTAFSPAPLLVHPATETPCSPGPGRAGWELQCEQRLPDRDGCQPHSWPLLSQQLHLSLSAGRNSHGQQGCKTPEGELLFSPMHPRGSWHRKGNLGRAGAWRTQKGHREGEEVKLGHSHPYCKCPAPGEEGQHGWKGLQPRRELVQTQLSLLDWSNTWWKMCPHGHPQQRSHCRGSAGDADSHQLQGLGS